MEFPLIISLFPMLSKVESIRRNFLREGGQNKRKLYLVKQETDTRGKKTGGLRIKNLKMQHNSFIKMALEV